MPLLSIRAYARHRAERGLSGTSHKAVQKALATGRIQANATGLIDSDAADRAWAANTSEGHRRSPPPDAAPPAAAPAARAPAARAPAAPPTDDSPRSITFQQASAIEKAYKAKLAKLEYEERIRELVAASEVAAAWSKVVTAVRNKVLGLPTRIRQRVQHLSHADIAAVEQLVRETLVDLARGEFDKENAA